MAEEIEVPTEHLHEYMKHGLEGSGAPWIRGVALSSVILAIFAAVAALMAVHHANEAILERIKSSDQWNYFQAKSIKSAILESKMETLRDARRTPSRQDEERILRYKEEQEKIGEEARHAEASSEAHLRLHVLLARAVTFFQVAIAIGAIAVLARRRSLWLVSLVFGSVGIVFFVLGQL